MIRVDRERLAPQDLAAARQALADARTRRFTVAQAHVAAGTLVIKDHLVDYDTVKPALHEAQHRKCCWCEKSVDEAEYNDVEHYRPKSVYWWLAWEWTNLMFACPNCNRSAKNDAFPLAPGSPVLQAPPAAPVAEAPLLLDPADLSATDDPLDLIHFRRSKGQWTPFAPQQNLRGSETIRVLKLDRPSLLTAYTSHVDELLAPEVGRLAEKMAPGMHMRARVHEAWRRLTGRYLNHRQPYLALVYHALPQVLDERATGWRAFDLAVPRPPL